MAKYSVGQLQGFLREAGFPENEIVRMAAIGMAESAGNSGAVNPGRGAGGRRTNEYSVGLWQINTKVHKKYTVEELKNPQTNAKEALRIYRMQGLRAWGAYTNGNYKKFLKASEAAYQGRADLTYYPKPDGSQNSSADPSNPVVKVTMTTLVFVGAIAFILFNRE
jgi:hypothetical protein